METMKAKFKLGQVLEYNSSLSYDTIIIVGIEKMKDSIFYTVVNLDVIDNKKDEQAVYYESVDDIDNTYNDQIYKVWNNYSDYLKTYNKNYLKK